MWFCMQKVLSEVKQNSNRNTELLHGVTKSSILSWLGSLWISLNTCFFSPLFPQLYQCWKKCIIAVWDCFEVGCAWGAIRLPMMFILAVVHEIIYSTMHYLFKVMHAFYSFGCNCMTYVWIFCSNLIYHTQN